MYRYAQRILGNSNTGAVDNMISHASHNYEMWHAYLDSNLPEEIDRNATGICCHDCSVVVWEV